MLHSGRLGGVMHTATVYEDERVEAMSWESWMRVAEVKVRGAVNLHHLTERAKRSPKASEAQCFGLPSPYPFQLC